MEQEKQATTNHYYQGGINFVGCTLTNNTFQTLNPAPAADMPADVVPSLPDCLDTPRAHDVLSRLTQAGLVDERWQPMGLSVARRGVLASTLAAELGIAHTWKTFGALWGMNPDLLRAKYNEGMNQKHMGEFMSQINKLLE